MRFRTLAFWLFGILLPCFSHAGTLDTDTTIDSSHTDSNTRITVVDGPGGPATIRIVEGGIAAGVRIYDKGTVVVDGGMISLPSSVEDQGRLIVLGGSVACTDPECEFANPSHLVQLTGQSSLAVRGGFIEGTQILLLENSSAEFYGTDLALVRSTAPGFAYVLNGVLQDGSIIGAFLRLDSDPAGRVFLHNIPEPYSVALIAIAALPLAFSRKANHRSCACSATLRGAIPRVSKNRC